LWQKLISITVKKENLRFPVSILRLIALSIS
jgi:hypothetical protein